MDLTHASVRRQLVEKRTSSVFYQASADIDTIPLSPVTRMTTS